MKKIMLVVAVVAAGLSVTGVAHAVTLTDNGNGTLTDSNGRTWLKNANCFGKMSWSAAYSAVAGLQSGSCGLTDGSRAGQWRLYEDAMNMISVLCSGASKFTNLQSDLYWTGQQSQQWSGWYLTANTNCSGQNDAPSNAHYVLPVR